MSTQTAPVAQKPAQSGSYKVLKDFMLGGTSGAIAKTLAAPIERVKLLLQTQENNPKLMERPYTGNSNSIQESWTVSADASNKKDLHLYGEATGPTWSDTSLPKPSTSQPKMLSMESSSRELTLK